MHCDKAPKVVRSQIRSLDAGCCRSRGRRERSGGPENAAVPPARLERRAKFAERCRFPASSFVVPMRRQLGPAQTRRQKMRVMVFAKATEDSEKGAAPTPEALEAFAAMDRFIEELVKAGVFIAGAGRSEEHT